MTWEILLKIFTDQPDGVRYRVLEAVTQQKIIRGKWINCDNHTCLLLTAAAVVLDSTPQAITAKYQTDNQRCEAIARALGLSFHFTESAINHWDHKWFGRRAFKRDLRRAFEAEKRRCEQMIIDEINAIPDQQAMEIDPQQITEYAMARAQTHCVFPLPLLRF